jgi:hypothetical protein
VKDFLVLQITPNSDKFSSMNIRDYIKDMSKEQRMEFAKRCGTSLGHLQNVAYGYKPCNPELAMAVEEETDHAVKVETIAPGCRWHVIRGKAA